MADNHDILAHFSSRLDNLPDLYAAVVQRERRLRADASLGGQSHMGNQYIRSGFRHGFCLLRIEDVWTGEHIQLVCFTDHVNLQSVSHSCLLQVSSEFAVN